MVAVKTDILSYLKKPIHHSWFGMNKTWRGFVMMPVATWPGVILGQWLETIMDLTSPLLLLHSSYKLAIFLGFAYCIAELPNSFMKRRLGIKEGQTSESFKWFFVVMDQADSVIGCLIAYLWLLEIGAEIFLGTLIMGTVIHLFFNLLLYSFKLRKNPF